MKKVFIAREGSPAETCTGMLQEMIDRCAEEGGGQVRLSAGTYLCGTLRLKTGVELYLDAGAVLRGSADCRDYSHFCPLPTKVEGVPQWYNALITAADARDISILGEGVIDGADCFDPAGEQGFRGPHAVFFYNCERIRVEGVTIVRAACYSLMFERCGNIRVRNVSIYGGQDGFRFGACRDAAVIGCDVRSGDDCIGGSGNEDVCISDTALNTPGGSVLQFSARRLHVKNCVFWAPGVYPAVFREEKRYSVSYAAVCAGFDYGYPRGEDSDEWLFEDVRFENPEMLFRWEKDLYGRKNIPLRRITFRRVRAVGMVLPSLIEGGRDCPIELTIRDSTLGCVREDPRCEGLLLRGSGFEKLEMENVVLRGYGDRPFDLHDVGTISLRNVRIEKTLTEECLDSGAAERTEILPGKTETILERFVSPGSTSVMKPKGAGEEFRGAIPYIPVPDGTDLR